MCRSMPMAIYPSNIPTSNFKGIVGTYPCLHSLPKGGNKTCPINEISAKFKHKFYYKTGYRGCRLSYTSTQKMKFTLLFLLVLLVIVDGAIEKVSQRAAWSNILSMGHHLAIDASGWSIGICNSNFAYKSDFIY